MLNLASLFEFLQIQGCFDMNAKNSRDISYTTPLEVNGRLKMAPSGKITEWLDGEKLAVHQDSKAFRIAWLAREAEYTDCS